MWENVFIHTGGPLLGKMKFAPIYSGNKVDTYLTDNTYGIGGSGAVFARSVKNMANIANTASGQRRYRNESGTTVNVQTGPIKTSQGGYGTTNKAALVTAFLGANGMLDGATSKLFAVVDSNSFHHMSYILARYAMETHASATNVAKKVVINFDAHPDLAKCGTDLKCNNWATAILADRAGYYVTVGLKGMNQPMAKFKAKAKASSNWTECEWLPGKRGQGRVATGPYVEKLLTACNVTWNGAKVYITVDRDFMLGSYTQWGDSSSYFDALTGRELVANCLVVLERKQADVVGFDITGLPETTGSAKMNITDTAKIIAQMNEDVKHARGRLAALFP